MSEAEGMQWAEEVAAVDDLAVRRAITGREPVEGTAPHHRAIPLIPALNRQTYLLWSRTQELDMRSRRLATIGALTALGATDELRVHITGALRNGDLTAAELGELGAHLTTYLGWPRVRAFGAILDSAMDDAT